MLFYLFKKKKNSWPRWLCRVAAVRQAPWVDTSTRTWSLQSVDTWHLLEGSSLALLGARRPGRGAALPRRDSKDRVLGVLQGGKQSTAGIVMKPARGSSPALGGPDPTACGRYTEPRCEGRLSWAPSEPPCHGRSFGPHVARRSRDLQVERDAGAVPRRPARREQPAGVRELCLCHSWPCTKTNVSPSREDGHG